MEPRRLLSKNTATIRMTRQATNVASQATGADTRTLGVMLKVPEPFYRLIFGTEWYVRRDVPSGSRLRHPFEIPPKG